MRRKQAEGKRRKRNAFSDNQGSNLPFMYLRGILTLNVNQLIQLQ